jgi:hypothetical protein
MYAEHVPSIAAYMRADADQFVRGALFALLSIRQRFVTVPNQMADVEKRGARSPFLFGSKLAAWRYIRRHKRELFAAVTGDDTRAALQAVSAIPGIGLVKGAFILQLAGHDVACLDSQNIEREGLDPRAFRSDARIKKSKAWARKLDRYLAETGGKARFYWDAWCDYVGPQYGLSGEECSAIHLAIVTRDCGRVALPCGNLSHSGDIPF